MSRLQSEWQKHGLIIKPDPSKFWCLTHCMIPTPLALGNGLVRIYFSGRDHLNRSHIGHATIDLNDTPKVVERSHDPVLLPGRLGCFDDNGVTPSCLINLSPDLLAMYYIGWNPGSTVRMHLFGGLAISRDQGKSFERWSEAPILERCRTDPFLNTAPWVIKVTEGYRMYYVSGSEWRNKDLPRYNIKTAFSLDGLHWERTGQVCIDFKDEKECALARPFVRKNKDGWEMWFASKSENTQYSMCYAESKDGIQWRRDDDASGIKAGPQGFDDQMIEYACIVRHRDKEFMFYNGNNYGVDGIGLASR